MSSSRAINSFELISDTSELASTHGYSDSSFYSIHKKSSSPSENCGISSSASSSFASKDDLTSYSSSTKINFDSSFFEHHISDVISDLDLDNSTDHEDSLHDYELEGPNLNIDFEPFFMTRYEDTTFADDISTSSFLKDIITIFCSKISTKLNTF